MIYPSIADLTKGKFNRYELVIGAAKSARLVTDEYVAQREKAEKMASVKKDEDASFYYKNTVENKMVSLRRYVDEMETLTARDAWPMPTYGDITFKI